MTDFSVLIADDDAKIRRLLRVNFERRNYRVAEVENGRQVIEYLGDNVPDLLVVDLGMPVINGYDVCAWVRRHDIKIPIVVLSAYAERDMELRAMDAGASTFIAKPFRMDEFLTRITGLLPPN